MLNLVAPHTGYIFVWQLPKRGMQPVTRLKRQPEY